jgi:Fe-S cluster assembly protein SufD
VLSMLEKREVGVEAGGPFAAVGSALARDVCVIDLPAGLAVEKPIAVVCLASGGVDEGTASAAAPRIAVRTGENASVQLLETHAVLDGVARPWACVISGSAFEVGAGASVEHYVVNDMPVTAHHLAHVHADVAKDGVYKGRSLMLGGQVCRVSLGVDLNGVGARGEAFGVMIADGKRVTDLHSRISHNAPSCTSNQYQKNIASGNGRVVFSGKILVQKVAQETDSQQLCRSMLLSNKARVDAMPVLEISADQVKCTHGATVSDLSQEELFYCQTRGISESKAQELLLASFALDVLADCPFQMLKERTSLSARALIPSIQKVDINDRTELYQSI